MKLKHTKILLLIISISVLIACNQNKTKNSKPTVSVSIGPQKYFVEQLTDTLLNVNVMVPPGASHATYSPTPSQLVKLSQSEAYFLMGHLSFETTWEDKLETANNKLKWYNLSKNITPIEGDHDHHHHDDELCSHGVDPHTWTSPKEVKQIINNLKEALLELHPEFKETIEKNHQTFMAKIDELDARLLKLQSINPDLSFMIFHPAYTYLAQSYGFEQITIEFEGKTPTPARMQKTIQDAKKKNITTIYIQEEFDKTNAETIANSINSKTVQVNPLSENWLEEMNRFITHLEKN
ncbi:metal ABC transporter solute-binding protein, Zn/Mn family [Carboxylicivirga caseinilyticus]|uniref:metal ABC transporter solute-binding protein, Zn/Mn family n=1 Tax=Carboxylicivirga caseinilyticus TaxID=3417572 RepID=UPI003D33FDD5|nr:zinc ABC transporter substrate-binding protein [Marinilabiliaceae bacterium A049]